MLERLFDILDLQRNNPAPAFSVRMGDRTWKAISYNEYRNRSWCLAGSLVKKGINPKQAVGSILENRPEWNIIDLGCQMVGGIHVSLFPTFSQEILTYSLNHAEVKILFVANRSLYRWVLEIEEQLPHLNEVILIQSNGASDFNMMTNAHPGTLIGQEIELRKEKVKPTDICSILYTSGTSEQPKGVPITHERFIKYAQSMLETYGGFCGRKVMSFLPLCHGFERSHSYFYQMEGKTVYYANPSENLEEKILETEVSFFTGVPMLVKSISQFGKTRMVAVSGAPLDTKDENKLREKGIETLQSYGCTEALGVTANTYSSSRQGTVGKPLDHVHLKVNSEGLIFVKSESLFNGYWKSDEQVKGTDGFFKTGDVGQLDKDGFLRISGREGDMFKTQNGRFFTPTVLEEQLRAIPFIEHAMVVGAGKPFLAAVLVLSQDQNFVVREVRNQVVTEIKKMNFGLTRTEHIERFVLLPVKWSTKSGEFTHNMKLRRSFILSKYRKTINQLYDERDK
jgi:long-chain acyl-CoA synthetase